MTTTTINRLTQLRALADHIEGCELSAEDITTIQFADAMDWDALALHIHTAGATAAWVRSLGDVSAKAFWHGGSVHIRITGAMDDVPVRLLFIATPHDRDVIAEFRHTLVETSSWNGGEPIELPEILGGARRQAVAR